MTKKYFHLTWGIAKEVRTHFDSWMNQIVPTFFFFFIFEIPFLYENNLKLYTPEKLELDTIHKQTVNITESGVPVKL